MQITFQLGKRYLRLPLADVVTEQQRTNDIHTDSVVAKLRQLDEALRSLRHTSNKGVQLTAYSVRCAAAVCRA